MSILLINGSNLNDKYVKQRRWIRILIEKKRASEVHSIFNTGDYSKCLDAIDTYMKLSSLKQR